jgi:hypothetical protein
VWIAEIVAPAEPHRSRPASDEPAVQQAVQLIQIEVHERDAVAQLVGAHREAAVTDRALVDRADGHIRTGSVRCPASSPTTRRALLRPSSWKPHPQ